ncbi:hypothetical protein AMECASPLE_014566 [Ameca splendens]|uniref:Uncharacterized protein n=1 Tax=Ameca splendens TaxID=208324 RepID=A0ABV0YD39_9TELE
MKQGNIYNMQDTYPPEPTLDTPGLDHRLSTSVTSSTTSWLCNQLATIISKPCSPSNKLPCKPHHPANHATFVTPRLNWTSWKQLSSIHRLTYLGYYSPQSPLVSCCQTPHLFPPGSSIISSIGDLPVLVLATTHSSKNKSLKNL